ncbi:hypothetical protein SARC_06269 [Sphaeroforma arctica JP610]|uniref:Uncharacterized protein n=1 Tax=Sphaeroforma arctica JP610 TaxID=667725 RepID=A0A0L0FX31_9EUKA|nr:hypothetical protein SARC_06269 [Sphaeroforma arctica JP610]KNC81405.1 hypothetical protein SARC_06269 [Sphaeroforma arctica JP610]|eukprot:XP_014155307.1 hypothetical protein SARC_06269 [Sphaeroforma arctica JP610]
MCLGKPRKIRSSSLLTSTISSMKPWLTHLDMQGEHPPLSADGDLLNSADVPGPSDYEYMNSVEDFNDLGYVDDILDDVDEPAHISGLNPTVIDNDAAVCNYVDVVPESSVPL